MPAVPPRPEKIAFSRPLWAGDALRRAAGDTLRPGGLELTLRGLELAGVGPGARVLDVGCGLGATVQALRGAGYRAVGLDAEPGQIFRGGRVGQPLAAGRAEALPHARQSFGAVLMECVLSLVPDAGAALAEARRVLVPGGRLVVSDLYARAGREASGVPDGCVRGAFDLDEFSAQVRGAGFAVLALEDHTRLLKDLAARLILAGERLPGGGCFRAGYFLLALRKTGDVT